MARRKKPLVDGAQAGLDELRRRVRPEVMPPATPFRNQFLTIARKMAEDLEDPPSPS
ncbi:MAG: hypothetical protein ACYCT0_01955 [Sulfobacillus sp.]